MTTHETGSRGWLSRLAGWNWLKWIVVAGLVFGAYMLGGGSGTASEEEGHVHEAAGGQERSVTWTCPMHPQIKSPSPGQCPICGMDLVPMQGGAADAGPRALAMSESDKALARIETALVERRPVEMDVRMVGKVDYDETRVKTVAAWIPGRLDRLFVDYTGVHVNKGDHMVHLYSPELLAAQEELIGALRGLDETEGEQSAFLRESSRRMLESAREKLRLWGLTDQQIAAIEARGKVSSHMTITSPLSGYVIEKHAVEGMYVKTGTPIYKVADLSMVWVYLDVYEMDFSWVRFGQRVELEVEAFPGEVFLGRVSFVPPFMDDRTRTKKVRVNMKNDDLKLRPGMFVRAVIHSRVSQGGQVVDPSLAGKWMCPMHPDVIADGPEDCQICGMDLVECSKLGMVVAKEVEDPIVVPASAVLLTGKRAVVYVEVPDAEMPTYEGREIVVGPRAGDVYVVRSGLKVGERVVTNGAFKIDSSLQIQAKPSMLSMPAEQEEKPLLITDELRAAVKPAIDAYLDVQVALSKDDLERAGKAARDLVQKVSSVNEDRVVGRSGERWRRLADELVAAAEKVAAAGDIEAARTAFADLARTALKVADTFGPFGPEPLREAFCPMALDGKGAAWLQRADKVENPFYGSSMYRCGEIRRVIEGGKK